MATPHSRTCEIQQIRTITSLMCSHSLAAPVELTSAINWPFPTFIVIIKSKLYLSNRNLGGGLSAWRPCAKLTSSMTSLNGRPECNIWPTRASVRGLSVAAEASPVPLDASSDGAGDCEPEDVLLALH